MRGVDPLDDAIYDDAFHYFEDLLNEFEKFGKIIYNSIRW